MPIDMSHSIKMMKTIGLKLGYEVLRNRNIAWYDANKERVQRAYGPHFDETVFMQATLEVDRATIESTFKKIDCLLYEMAYDKLTKLKSDVLSEFYVAFLKAIKHMVIMWFVMFVMLVGTGVLFDGTSGAIILLAASSLALTLLVSDNELMAVRRFISLKKAYHSGSVEAVINSIANVVMWTFGNSKMDDFRYRLDYIHQYIYKRK